MYGGHSSKLISVKLSNIKKNRNQCTHDNTTIHSCVTVPLSFDVCMATICTCRNFSRECQTQLKKYIGHILFIRTKLTNWIHRRPILPLRLPLVDTKRINFACHTDKLIITIFFIHNLWFVGDYSNGQECNKGFSDLWRVRHVQRGWHCSCT